METVLRVKLEKENREDMMKQKETLSLQSIQKMI